MWATILGWFMASKGAKATFGATVGGGLLTLILSLHASVNTKIDSQDKTQKAYVKEYVQLSIKPVHVEIINLKKGQDKTQQMLRDISNHLLNSKPK